MKSKLVFRVLLFVFVFSITLPACLHTQKNNTLVSTATPPGWIIEWLEEPSCQPPCWEMIQPGITHIDAISSITQRYPDMSVETVPGSSIVQIITLHLSIHDNLPISLFTSKFGKPNYVRIYKCDPNKKCETHVIFMEIGMILDLYPDNLGEYPKDSVYITPSTSVFKVYFLEASIENYYNIFFGNIEEDDTIPWAGYTEYSYPQ